MRIRNVYVGCRGIGLCGRLGGLSAIIHQHNSYKREEVVGEGKEAYLDIESKNWIFTTCALETGNLGVEEVVWALTRSWARGLLWTLLGLWMLILVVCLSWMWLLVLLRRFITGDMLLSLLSCSAICRLRTGIVVAIGSFLLSVGSSKATFRGIAVAASVLLAGHNWRVRCRSLERLTEGAVVLG